MVKSLKIQKKEWILKHTWEKNQVTHRDKLTRVEVGFLEETLEDEGEWDNENM